MRGTPFDQRRRGAGTPARVCLGGLRLVFRLAVGLAMLALAAAVLLWLRLLQGPLAMPQVAEIAARMVNAAVAEAHVEIGGAVLTLGRGGVPSGLQFTDVRVRAPDGTPLLAAPRLAARFHLADMLLGRLEPTRIVLVGAEARVLREPDGRIRVGLGGGGVALPGGGEGPPGQAGMAAVATIMDGFAGDTPPPPVLSRLSQVAILGARLTYEDAVSGRRWRTSGSDLRLWRTAEGARAEMRAALSDSPAATTRIAVAATRRAGTGRTEFRLRFRDLQPDDLAEQATALEWVRLVDAPLSGRIHFAIPREGGLEDLAGEIAFRDGAILALDGPARRIDRGRLAFSAEGSRAPLEIAALEIAGPALDLSASGRIAVEGGDPLADGALAIQLDLHSLRVDLEDMFAAPLAFDGGQAVARLALAPLALDIAHLHLARGPMALQASGHVRPGAEGEGPEARLRLSGRAITVEDLKAHWPLAAAKGAREWVVEHLVSGDVPELVGHLAVGPDGPALDLAFRFEALESRYLGPMTPIRDASGRGTLTLERFDLWLEEGGVAPVPGAPIALGGSRVTMPDLDEPVPSADIRIAAAGTAAAVLALIDEQPLGLVRRLGRDLSGIGGTAEVEAAVALPLLADLAIEDVAVSATAALRDVRLALETGEGETVAVAADRLALLADTQAMTVQGAATADGVPLTVDWRETYGGTGPEGTELVLEGALTPALLEARGLALAAFEGGRAPVRLRYAGTSAAATLELEADLGPARLAVPELRWEKPDGVPGRLSVSAALGAETRIERVRLDAAGLVAEGSASLGPGGALAEARIERFRLDGRADLSGRVRRAADGALDIRLEGPLLDLSDFVTDPEDSETDERAPMRLAASVGRLLLTPKFVVEPAEAMLVLTAGGEIKLELSGRAGGETSFEARYARLSGAPGTVAMTSADAGGLLSALGLFEGGQGGSLRLDAALKPEAGTDVSGTVTISDMTVRRAATFGSILEEGGVTEAAEAVQGGGLAFDSIEVPFTYADGVMRLGDSVARSPLLAVKVEGTVDETADRIDLAGVISPAYALTGALDEIPLLGALLSGGRGEGILAMTFSVTGTLDAPDFTVNPLSLLTPGFLRSIFSGRTRTPSDEFLDQLGPPG